jgi:CheY-like chemotaxis protein
VQLILDPAALARLAYPAPTQPALGGAPLGPNDSGTFPMVGQRDARARVLVADDSRAVREAVARMLVADGYVVDIAEDGAQAWTMLHEVRYDLLVTDLEMPRLTGFQLIEKVRASRDLGHLPVVVVSSKTENAPHLRADAFLPKPVSRGDISRRAAEILGRRRSP